MYRVAISNIFLYKENCNIIKLLIQNKLQKKKKRHTTQTSTQSQSQTNLSLQQKLFTIMTVDRNSRQQKSAYYNTFMSIMHITDTQYTFFHVTLGLCGNFRS